MNNINGPIVHHRDLPMRATSTEAISKPQSVPWIMMRLGAFINYIFHIILWLPLQSLPLNYLDFHLWYKSSIKKGNTVFKPSNMSCLPSCKIQKGIYKTFIKVKFDLEMEAPHWHSSYRPNLHLRQLECNNICPHFNVACECPHGDTNYCWKCSGVVRIYHWWVQSKDDIRKEMIKINWCKSRLS